MRPAFRTLKLAVLPLAFAVTLSPCQAQTTPAYTSDPKFQGALAAAQAKGGGFAESLARWKAASALANGQCMECLHNVIEIQFALKQWKDEADTAIQMYDRAITHDDKLFAATAAGRALMWAPTGGITLEQITQAEHYLKLAIDLHSTMPLMYYQEGRALASMHKDDEAKVAFQRFLEIAPADNTDRGRAEQYAKDPTLAARKLRGEATETDDGGQTQAATASAKSGLAFENDPKFREAKSLASDKSNIPDEERLVRWQLAAELSNNQCTYCLNAMMHIQMNQMKWNDVIATSHLYEAASSDSDNKQIALNVRGWALLHKFGDTSDPGLLAQAHSVFQSVLQVAPGTWSALHMDWIVLKEMGKEREAAEVYALFLNASTARDANSQPPNGYPMGLDREMQIVLVQLLTKKHPEKVADLQSGGRASIDLGGYQEGMRHATVKLPPKPGNPTWIWYQASPVKWIVWNSYSKADYVESYHVVDDHAVVDNNHGTILLADHSSTLFFVPDADALGTKPDGVRFRSVDKDKWDSNIYLAENVPSSTATGYGADPKYQKEIAELRDPKITADEKLARLKHLNKITNDQCLSCLRALLVQQTSQDQWKDATGTAALMQAVATMPSDKFFAEVERGRALMHANNGSPKPEQLAEADASLTAALALSPRSKDPLYSEGRVLAMMGRYDDAKTMFQRYLEVVDYSDSYRTRVEHFLEDPTLATKAMAPPFTFTSSEGEQMSLDDMHGKVVLLDFWATWCGPCKASLPDIQHIAKEFTGEPFVVVSISSDQNEFAWKQFIRDNKMDWPQYRDTNGDLQRTYGVASIPRYFTIDTDGVLKDVKVGGGIDVISDLRPLVNRARKAEKKKATAVTTDDRASAR